MTGVRLQVLRDQRFLFAIRAFMTQTVVHGFSFSSPVPYVTHSPRTWPSESNSRCRRVIQSPGCSVTDCLAHILHRGGSTTLPLVTMLSVWCYINTLFPIKWMEIVNTSHKSYWIGMQSEHPQIFLCSSTSKLMPSTSYEVCFNGLKIQCQNFGNLSHWKCSEFKNEYLKADINIKYSNLWIVSFLPKHFLCIGIISHSSEFSGKAPITFLSNVTKNLRV